MATWQKTGLLGWEDKNGDGRIQYYNDANAEMQAKAAENGWEGNELTNFNRDILVLANPEIANLPSWVIGLVAAGGIAAALSTAAGLLLAISSAVSHDLIKGRFNPGISEKGELMSARVAMAAAIIVASYLGLNPPGFAAQTVALAFGIAAASLFPVLMMGIFTKVNNKGAVAGMLAGLIGHAGLHLPAQGLVLHPRHQQLHRRRSAAGHDQVDLLRGCGGDDQLCGGLHRVEDDGPDPARDRGPGRERARAQRCRCRGCRPLNEHGRGGAGRPCFFARRYFRHECALLGY